MSDRVTVAISNGIADVRMNRPDKRNVTFLYRVLLNPADVLKSQPREIELIAYHSKLPRDASPSLTKYACPGAVPPGTRCSAARMKP